MRRFRICEERGSGIDKVVAQVDLDKDERIRACYWHACLKYVQSESVTNTTIRARFGVEEQSRAMAS